MNLLFVFTSKQSLITSKTEHGLFCLNIGVPPSKSEYFSMTDSVQVP
jgi:hypothetical protein